MQQASLLFLLVIVCQVFCHASEAFATPSHHHNSNSSNSSSRSSNNNNNNRVCNSSNNCDSSNNNKDNIIAMQMSSNNDNNDFFDLEEMGRLEELKLQEAELSRQLAAIRSEKKSALRARPLTIGVIGFGRFGQFISKTFAKHGNVVATSRSDYTDIASAMGVTYIPQSNFDEFCNQNLDVIIVATSILSFESTILKLKPSLEKHIKAGNEGPLIVDVLSVKEHARQVMLEHLPEECDILCTHPMFGPDSGKNGWQGLNFVYERTRLNKIVLDHGEEKPRQETDITIHDVPPAQDHVKAMDRVERFLSIWEEEGCRMVNMSCREHDTYAANSQFITHLMGRILGTQGLAPTPIDTRGFESVLKLVDSTTADSFELFYGLYKFNQNSLDTINQLRAAMDDVVENLQRMEQQEDSKSSNNGNNKNKNNNGNADNAPPSNKQEDLLSFLKTHTHENKKEAA